MNIEDLDYDTSLQAQAAYELEGLTTFTIPGTAFVALQRIEKCVHIKTLFVTKSKRRQGIGSSIFRIIEKEACRAGHLLIGLSIDTSHIDPAGALAFAEKLGLRIKESGSGPGHIGLIKTLLHSVPAPCEPLDTKQVHA